MLADISKEAEGDEGLVSEGVSMAKEVVLELDRECVLVLRGFPPKDLLFWLLVIAQRALSVRYQGQKVNVGGEPYLVLTLQTPEAQ